MHTRKFNTVKLNTLIAIVLVVLFSITCFADSKVYAAVDIIAPTASQYLELRAVEVNDLNSDGENMQVIMELWSHDLEFKGFEVTFSFDATKYQTSNISTNVVTDDASQFFSLTDEFNGKLYIDTFPRSNANELDFTVTTIASGQTSTHFVDDGSGRRKITTVGEDVKLGTMSFKLAKGKSLSIEKVTDANYTDFNLLTNEYTPTTGIRINKSATEAYQAQSTFRFTDESASRNAYLSNLIVSSGTVDEIDPTNSTYKEYTLTPIFNKDVGLYEITLMEYIDTIDIKATLEDNTATMKLKTPKKQDDKLVLEGANIVYEENTLVNDTKTAVTINKLGEPDTEITVMVKAEDGTTTKDYKVTIKRPYATIKGEIYTSPTAYKEKYISNIRLYNSTDVAAVINWDNLIDVDVQSNVHTNLLSLESANYLTEENGKYEIYVIPKTYDIVLDKDGYLDHVYKERTLNIGDVLDLGFYELVAGDLNKDGIIDVSDVSLVNSVYLLDSLSPDYEIYKYYDFNEDLIIDVSEVSNINSNYLKEIEVE